MDGPEAKRIKSSQDSSIYTKNIAFFRNHYTNDKVPKFVLHTYAKKENIDIPTYETKQEDRLFQTVLTFQGKQYCSSYWEKNKRFAEQGSALVCLLGLGLVEEDDLIKNGSLSN